VLQLVVVITQCKLALRVPLAVLSSTAERQSPMQDRVEGAIGCIKQHSRTSLLLGMLASPPVSGMTRQRISGSRRYFSGGHQMPAESLRHLTTACSRLFLALTKLLPYILDVEASPICLVSTAWSRTDRLVIVSLKAHTSIVTQPDLSSGC